MTDAAVAAAPHWLFDEEKPVDRAEMNEYLDALSPSSRAQVFDFIRSQGRWRRSPGALARRLDPSTLQTPALELIDTELVELIDSPPPETGGIRGLIIQVPPQEGKTERITRRGTEWILQRNQDARVGLVSFDQENVRRTSFQIRADIEVFDGTEGNVDLGLRLRRGEKAAARWNLQGRRGGVYAIGVGGGLTGRPLDALIIDDPVKDYRSADSTLISEQTWTWWLSVARPRLAPGAPVILVLTRWSPEDLAGRLIREQKIAEESNLLYYDRWRVINIPAQADHDPSKGEVDPLGREPGEWLVSARGRTVAQWEATKTSTMASGGSRVWSALYQGQPTPQEGGEIKRHWFRYETELPESWSELLGSWDMKLKEKRSGDYQSGGMWGRVGAHYYLLEVWRGQWDFPTIQAAIALSRIRYPRCSRHLVENTGNGPEVMAELRKERPDYELSEDIIGELRIREEEIEPLTALLRRGMSGLVAENPKGSKTARVRAISGEIESGHVHLPAAAHWSAAFVDECSGFGVGGKHDDQVDMMSQALRRLSSRPADDEPVVKVAQGRVPRTLPDPNAPRRPRAGRIPGATRQADIVRRQLGGKP